MNDRRFRRIPFEADVTVSHDRSGWTGELLDVAMKGALVGMPTPLPITLGTVCRLCITLPGSPISLDFEAILVHREDDHYGFKFVSEDLVTLTHLRKLIELNTGDVETTRCELAAWLND